MAAVEVPQTLKYRGGQLNVADVLEVENFTNWKKSFMCHIIGIEPQFENIISNGPYISMASGQRKPETQWTPEERKATNLDQRLKSLIMSVLPNDQMNSVINCLTTKSTWDDLILYHEGPSDVKESKDFQDSPDDEEDTRSSHDAKATDQTECYKYGKKGHFVRDCWSKTSVPSYQSHFQPKLLHSSEYKPESRHTKVFKAKYNKVKVKLTLLNSRASTLSSSCGKNKGLIAKTYDWDKEEMPYDTMKKKEALQAKKVESFKASKTESSSALRLKTPTKRLNNLKEAFQSSKKDMSKIFYERLDLNGKAVNESQYKGMIGSLMNLTTSRPDIQFSTGLYARHQANIWNLTLLLLREFSGSTDPKHLGPTSGIRATKREFERRSMKLWAMEIEHYLEYIDNDVWKKFKGLVKSERKAKPSYDGHYPKGTSKKKFMEWTNAKEICEAKGLSLRIRIDSNTTPQLELMVLRFKNEMPIHKFLRLCPSPWSNLAIDNDNKPEIDTLSIDDFTCNPFTSSSNIPKREAPPGFADEVIYSIFAKQSDDLDLLHEDLEQIDDVNIEEMDIN
ncbi:retrovirus-related pol polyprotein from transposon TNT 1-94 [Tanacetum coccineum]